MRRCTPEACFPNNHVVIFFNHFAIFEDRNKVMSSADLAVKSRPQLCPGKYGCHPLRIYRLCVCDMDVHHLGCLTMVQKDEEALLSGLVSRLVMEPRL
jgi:hypothetical protein